ncbi:MAG: ArgR family transcriptional regulator [Dysgonamonadaceae bacterium]|jgi:transcriptional regulator of arginine metabolism|nr:ArgR family transcriptional regulator [Dysgonamonadaceae bacterium]
MKSKKERLNTILNLVENHSLNNQEELLSLLKKRDFEITQATLSRDMKELKIIKSPDNQGNYIYTVSPSEDNKRTKEPDEWINRGFISLAFSHQLAVIKTRPGYAMGIASDIDSRISHAILGTIAGDDTILLVPKEGFSKNEIIEALTLLIPKSILIVE